MTAVAQIIEWINEDNRPIWLRHSLRLLLENDKLEVDDFKLIFRIARKEIGFNDELNPDDFNEPVSADGYTVEEHPVVLKKIGPLTNVGLVADGSALDVSETGLTVIYGNNGAGKSSYARILKNACLTRGERPRVIGNVFNNELGEPQAEIEYKVGMNTPVSETWSHSNDEIPYLKAVRVFDTKSANHYVEKEDTLSYKPAGLHLLDELTKVTLFVRGQAQKAIEANNKTISLPVLQSDTAAGIFLAGISKDTARDEFEAQFITEDEIAELEKLPVDIAKLSTSNPEKIRKDYTQKIERYIGLSGQIVKPLCGFADYEARRLESLRQNFKDKLEIYNIARVSAFSKMPIEGVGSSAWKALWDAAKTYSETAYPNQDFPVVNDGAKCPLCIQDIEEEAAERLKGFKAFVESTAQSELQKAHKAFNDAVNGLQSLSLNLSSQASVTKELSEFIEDFDQKIENLFQILQQRKSFLLAPLDHDREGLSLPEIDVTCLEKLSAKILQLKSELSNIQDDEGLKSLLEEKNNRLKELTDKKTLTDSREIIGKEISRKKALDAYGRLERMANTGSLTRLNTQINNLYVTSALETYFQEELKFFGFKYYSVGTRTRGDVGNQKFKLEITNSNHSSLGEIASEGEAKCFALSGALAELKTDSRKSGVVFDDPVNSLDHKWSSKVAKRLIQESLERQVIVFTHDLVFLKFLCEASESTDDHTLNIKSLDRSKAVSGIVRTNPPWDALTTAKRITYLNVLHRELKKIDLEGTDAEYNEKAGKFYGLLREAWERLVEEKLLNKVVERFSRGVPTQRLKRITDIEKADIDRVDEAMSKCSALLDGHDTAPGVYENMPAPDEIKADIENIKDYEQELTIKRKRN
tara:strand:- start:15353 stop:17959 length:2607 start_codon:yes stop_codon:yes gene_type:complete